MPTKSDSGKTSRPRIVLLMGAPGSGKGTQTTWLSNQLGLASLSTGEILRSEAKRNTPAGFMLRQTLASGALVNDETVCELVGAKLRRERHGNGLILDGFPRNVQQAEFLARLVEELGYNQPAVLHLDVSKEDLLRRLTGRRQCAVCAAVYNLSSRPSGKGSRCEKDGGALVQRDDDSEGVILERFRTFEMYAAPLIDFYRGPNYHKIAAGRPLSVVSEEILRILTAGSVRKAYQNSEVAA